MTSLLSLNASSHAGNTTVHPRLNSVPLWGRLAKASKVPTVVPSVNSAHNSAVAVAAASDEEIEKYHDTEEIDNWVLDPNA